MKKEYFWRRNYLNAKMRVNKLMMLLQTKMPILLVYYQKTQKITEVKIKKKFRFYLIEEETKN